jgi:hypothetical protein
MGAHLAAARFDQLHLDHMLVRGIHYVGNEFVHVGLAARKRLAPATTS